MFNCKKMGALDDDSYLVEDMSVQCAGKTYWFFTLCLAVPMGVCYVFGLPLYVLKRMYNNRDELTKEFDQINKNVLNRFHFLFKGYEPDFYYWEIIVMIRKILMVAVAVWLSYDIQIQALCATLLVVIALCVHALACPYVTDAMDGLELLSLFGSFCTYFFGQFLFTPSVGKGGRVFVSFVIVMVNLCVIGAVLCMVAGAGFSQAGAFGRKFRSIICCKKGVAEEENEEEAKDGDESDAAKTAPRNPNAFLLAPVASSSEPSPMKADRDESLESEPSRKQLYLKSNSDQDHNQLPVTPEIAEEVTYGNVELAKMTYVDVNQQ